MKWNKNVEYKNKFPGFVDATIYFLGIFTGIVYPNLYQAIPIS